MDDRKIIKFGSHITKKDITWLDNGLLEVSKQINSQNFSVTHTDINEAIRILKELIDANVYKQQKEC
ncbi:hypothetical protein [Methylophaga sp.]|uniref:hypothetical protein n=1 Tax=Methylophaga sp. TaxID=2024840 RepID=UPI003A8CB295